MAFPDGVPWAFQPAGPVLTFDSGPLQARVARDSGTLELAGPDLAGTPHANVIRLAAPAVLTSNGALVFGRVVSSQVVPNGLAFAQAVGTAQVQVTLTFVHEGVLRYEVVDWGTLKPLQTAV